MGMHLREEIARARSGDSVCRDRIAFKIAHGLGLDWDKRGAGVNGTAGDEPAAADLATRHGVNGGAATNGRRNGRRASVLGTSQLLNSVLCASDFLEEFPDELPLDFLLQLAGPGQHLDGEARKEAIHESGLLALLLLDAPSRRLLRERLYQRRTYYEISRDMGEPELEISSGYLRALRAWLQLATSLLENRAPEP